MVITVPDFEGSGADVNNITTFDHQQSSSSSSLSASNQSNPSSTIYDDDNSSVRLDEEGFILVTTPSAIFSPWNSTTLHHHQQSSFRLNITDDGENQHAAITNNNITGSGDVFNLLNNTTEVIANYGNSTTEAGDEQEMFLSSDRIVPLVAILGTLTALTLVGNILLIVAILAQRSMRRAVFNRTIVSIGVTGLLVALFVMPISILNEVSNVWFLGDFLCTVFTVLDVTLCTASIFHLLAIAIDRYLSATRVHYFRSRRKWINSMLFVAWVGSGLLSLLPVMGWKDPELASSKTGQCLVSGDPSFAIFGTTVAFYLPTFCIIAIYVRIYVEVRRRIRRHLALLAPFTQLRRSILRQRKELMLHSSQTLPCSQSNVDLSRADLRRSSSVIELDTFIKINGGSATTNQLGKHNQNDSNSSSRPSTPSSPNDIALPDPLKMMMVLPPVAVATASAVNQRRSSTAAVTPTTATWSGMIAASTAITATATMELLGKKDSITRRLHPSSSPSQQRKKPSSQPELSYIDQNDNYCKTTDINLAATAINKGRAASGTFFTDLKKKFSGGWFSNNRRHTTNDTKTEQQRFTVARALFAMATDGLGGFDDEESKASANNNNNNNNTTTTTNNNSRFRKGNSSSNNHRQGVKGNNSTARLLKPPPSRIVSASLHHHRQKITMSNKNDDDTNAAANKINRSSRHHSMAFPAPNRNANFPLTQSSNEISLDGDNNNNNDSNNNIARRLNTSTADRPILWKQRERRMAATSLSITLGFIVCWLPYFAVELGIPLCGCYDYLPSHPLFRTTINWFGYCNSLLNPIIFCLTSADFRIAFKALLKRQFS